jgi:peptide/nickel transport system permease protein
MLRTLGLKLLQTIAILWAVVTITFATTFLSPIDPAVSYAGQRATAEQIARARVVLGLDQPLPVQYVRYIGRVLQGDLGNSFVSGQNVRDLLLGQFPRTLALAAAAMVVQLLIGIPLGLLAALHRRRLLDRTILLVTLLGAAAPAFVVGFGLLYVFGYWLGWFPLGGADDWNSIVLPAVTLGVAGGAWYSRMLRSAALNILSEEYIRTARAKGLSERLVVFRHLLRNAIGPIVTLVGLDLGVFLGGVLIIEKVFAWPGIGLLAWQGIASNDVPVVLGAVLIAALFVTVLNLIADMVNAYLDPRTRYA